GDSWGGGRWLEQRMGTLFRDPSRQNQPRLLVRHPPPPEAHDPEDRASPRDVVEAGIASGRPRCRGIHHRPRTDRSVPVRRFLNGLGTYPVELAQAIGRGWNRFVFSPTDPTPLGLIRILVGALLTWSLFVYGLDLRAYFGQSGWMNLEIVEAFRHRDMPYSWSFWFYVPDAFLRPVWVLCLVVLVAFT